MKDKLARKKSSTYLFRSFDISVTTLHPASKQPVVRRHLELERVSYVQHRSKSIVGQIKLYIFRPNLTHCAWNAQPTSGRSWYLSIPSVMPACPPFTNLSISLQLRLDILQVLWGVDLNDLVDLGRVAHQFLCAGVQHLHLVVASHWEIVQHDVGHRQPSGVESERIAQEHEARSVVRQLIGNVLHIGVDGIILRQDLQRLLINLI